MKRVPQFRRRTKVIPTCLHPLYDRICNVPTTKRRKKHHVDHSNRGRPRRAFPPNRSKSYSTFFVDIFRTLFSYLRDHFLLFFYRVRIRLERKIDNFEGSHTYYTTAIPQKGLTLQRSYLLLFVLFFFYSLPKGNLYQRKANNSVEPLPSASVLTLPLKQRRRT